MNERILEAAFQSGFINKRVSDDTYFINDQKLKAKLEKFAELIIKECAELCHKQALVESERGTLTSLSKEVALDNIGIAITEHFGLAYD